MFLLDWWLNTSWMNFLSVPRRCLDLVLFLVAFHLEGHCSLSQSLGAYSVCVSSPGWSPCHSPSPGCHLRRVWNGWRYTFFSVFEPTSSLQEKSFLAPTIGGSIVNVWSPLLYLFLFWSTHHVYSRHHRLSQFGGNRFQAFQVVQGKPPIFRLKGRRKHWFLLCLLASHNAVCCFLEEGGDPLRGAALLKSFSTLIFLKQIRRD